MKKCCDNCAYDGGWDYIKEGSDEMERTCNFVPSRPDYDRNGNCEGWKCGKVLTPNDPIYIVDLETTGLDGYPTDHVVEVGVARFDQISGKVTPVYNAIIRIPEIRKIHEEKINPDGSRGCWVFNHTSLTLDKVENSKTAQCDVVHELRGLLDGQFVTSYNMPFDFGSFLDFPPWNLYNIAYPTKDIMDIATLCLKKMAERDAIEDKNLQKTLLHDWEYRPDKWVRSEVAYKVLCSDDPAQLHMKQTHRALDDAVMEGYILARATRYLSWDCIFAMTIPILTGGIGLIPRGESRP